jgi:hypothetical protein
MNQELFPRQPVNVTLIFGQFRIKMILDMLYSRGLVNQLVAPLVEVEVSFQLSKYTRLGIKFNFSF